MSQAQTELNRDYLDNQARLFRVWADIGEIVLLVLTCAAAKLIGRRLELLAKSTFLPDTGSGNAYALAAAMNMSESGFQQLAARKHIPRTKPGDELLFRFGDVTKSWQSPAESPAPSETTHGGCAKEKPRKPRGGKQGQK